MPSTSSTIYRHRSHRSRAPSACSGWRTDMDDKQVGWLITATHDDDDRRVGFGQCYKRAKETQSSFNAVIGRTIFMSTDMKADDIPFERRVKWRSFSDDGDPAYDGVVDIN